MPGRRETPPGDRHFQPVPTAKVSAAFAGRTRWAGNQFYPCLAKGHSCPRGCCCHQTTGRGGSAGFQIHSGPILPKCPNAHHPFGVLLPVGTLRVKGRGFGFTPSGRCCVGMQASFGGLGSQEAPGAGKNAQVSCLHKAKWHACHGFEPCCWPKALSSFSLAILREVTGTNARILMAECSLFI